MKFNAFGSGVKNAHDCSVKLAACGSEMSAHGSVKAAAHGLVVNTAGHGLIVKTTA